MNIKAMSFCVWFCPQLILSMLTKGRTINCSYICFQLPVQWLQYTLEHTNTVEWKCPQWQNHWMEMPYLQFILLSCVISLCWKYDFQSLNCILYIIFKEKVWNTSMLILFLGCYTLWMWEMLPTFWKYTLLHHQGEFLCIYSIVLKGTEGRGIPSRNWCLVWAS
jgi:hypothetical protein